VSPRQKSRLMCQIFLPQNVTRCSVSLLTMSKTSPQEVPENTTELKISKGELRPFIVTSPSPQLSKSRSVTSTKEKLILASLFIFAMVIRFHNVAHPDSVVFDEVHFGGFARKYILGTFFMDVHPPLAKLLFAGVGSLGGYDGEFEFKKIGDEFPENVPYVLMRYLPSGMGVGTCIMLYLTLRASGCQPIVCALTTALLIIENANVTISRFILLDSPMLFFIASTVYSFKKFQIQEPFTFQWYKTLIATGVSLGLAASSKWVGLFTVAWIGLITIWDLWFIIGDLTVSVKKIFGHFITRAVAFLVVPTLIYLTFFAIHLQVLTKEGDGGAFMSSVFRSTLEGNAVPKQSLANVGLGSLVTIRHLNTRGGYLHSHNHLYEGGSGQQQVTLYPHIDSNNQWIVQDYNATEEPTEFVPLKDGVKIRLNHKLTSRRLHSHNLRPPVTEQDWQNEVSAYGHEGFGGDANDDFVVEIAKDLSTTEEAKENVRAIQTVFRLRHAMTGCYLFSHEVKLPKWAYEQQEVTCATQGIKPLSYWYVETNENPFLDKEVDEIVSYPVPTFFQKVAELHARMWKINKGLTDHHVYESSPDSWPFLLRGISYWSKNHSQIYFIGNAVTWWTVTASIALFSVFLVFSILRWQRGFGFSVDPTVFNFNVQMLHYILGWVLHYLPSFLMARQLFLHHYLPSLYFGILALGHVFEIIHSYVFKNKQVVSYSIFVLFFAVALSFFQRYSPLIYAGRWTKDQCNESKILKWDFDCNTFPSHTSQYEIWASPVQTSTPKEGTHSESTVGEPDVEKLGETV